MISAEQKQKLLKLYRNKNLTLKDIANLCDISLPSVEVLVRQAVQAGVIKPRDEFRAGRAQTIKFTETELEEIAVDYYENSLTVAQLVEKWGIHPMQLQRVRKKFGEKYGKKTMGGEFRVKAVQQFDKQGNLIAEFPNGHQASAETGINYQTINRCCNGTYKSSGGFVWKFKEN